VLRIGTEAATMAGSGMPHQAGRARLSSCRSGPVGLCVGEGVLSEEVTPAGWALFSGGPVHRERRNERRPSFSFSLEASVKFRFQHLPHVILKKAFTTWQICVL
jgi:hypothetical protein